MQFNPKQIILFWLSETIPLLIKDIQKCYCHGYKLIIPQHVSVNDLTVFVKMDSRAINAFRSIHFEQK